MRHSEEMVRLEAMAREVAQMTARRSPGRPSYSALSRIENAIRMGVSEVQRDAERQAFDCPLIRRERAVEGRVAEALIPNG